MNATPDCNESHPFSRRSLLLGAAALTPVAFLGTSPGAPRAVAATNTDFATVRTQWRGTLIGNYDTTDKVITTYVQGLADTANDFWKRLDTSPSRTYLWADLDSGTVSAVQTSVIGRLRRLALAYASPGSSLSGNASLLADISSGQPNN